MKELKIEKDRFDYEYMSRSVETKDETSYPSLRISPSSAFAYL